MLTPDFWYKKHLTLPAILLWPFSLLFRLGGYLRKEFSTPQYAPIPTICVGNLTAGGSGKTPVAISIMQRLSQALPNHTGFFLSRGTKGSMRGPALVDSGGPASLFGDEPVLLSQFAPTVISRNRLKGAQFATQKGADFIVLDDGFQNSTLAPHVNLLVIDGEKGYGNLQHIPAGPLRETPQTGLDRADAVLLIGEDSYGVRTTIPSDIPVFTAQRKLAEPLPDKSLCYTVFCGIAHPNRFFNQCRDLDLIMVDWVAFPDHHAYTNAELFELMARARRNRSVLLTTEKDLMRIPHTFRMQHEIAILKMEIFFDQEDVLISHLAKIVETSHS